MNDDQEWRERIQSQNPDVPFEFLPSVHQHRLWGTRVRFEFGASATGEWLGSCPLHEPQAGSTNAVYNFAKGVMKCEANPSCHPGKRAISLNNLFMLMTQSDEK